MLSVIWSNAGATQRKALMDDVNVLMPCSLVLSCVCVKRSVSTKKSMNTNSNSVNCHCRETSISVIALYVLHCHFQRNSSIIFYFQNTFKYSKIHSHIQNYRQWHNSETKKILKSVTNWAKEETNSYSNCGFCNELYFADPAVILICKLYLRTQEASI